MFFQSVAVWKHAQKPWGRVNRKDTLVSRQQQELISSLSKITAAHPHQNTTDKSVFMFLYPHVQLFPFTPPMYMFFITVTKVLHIVGNMTTYNTIRPKWEDEASGALPWSLSLSTPIAYEAYNPMWTMKFNSACQVVTHTNASHAHTHTHTHKQTSTLHLSLMILL